MKRIGSAFVAFIGLSLLMQSCKKNDVNPDEVRLLAFETTDTSITYRKVFDYDNLGRITQVQFNFGTRGALVASIAYQGNQILMKPTPFNPAFSDIDSVVLIMDAANHVQKRLGYSFFEVLPPDNPQRTYSYDTTLYQYNAAGLLQKETATHRDSTWIVNAGDTQTWIYITNTISDYTNTDGNLASISSTHDATSYSHQHGKDYVSRSSTVSVKSFEYTKAYPNKTDFSNAAVLTELGYLQLQTPINKNYKNLPDKITSISTNRDQAGAITFVNNISSDFVLKYNFYGFLSAINNGSVKLIYNR
ncbi:MAG TPA: hypothetical protein VNT20_18710 [Flavisolibacter sp.]|jgi:hypothetical protein|nr:hypothetical protein [Flavisolibacter sp.]